MQSAARARGPALCHDVIFVAPQSVPTGRLARSGGACLFIKNLQFECSKTFYIIHLLRVLNFKAMLRAYCAALLRAASSHNLK